MKFRFDVHLSDEDYLNYNKFWALHSHYGKKQMASFRIGIVAVVLVLIIFILMVEGFAVSAVTRALPLVIFLIAVELLFAPSYVMVLKWHLKSLKSKGKMGYSPSSVLEFYDDKFIETTDLNKTEQKYTAIERISIVDGQTFYIHVNNIMAYILPGSCFNSKEQWDEFYGFISEKCSNIDT